MQPIGGKKALAICILKVLEDYSDFDHPMTQADIITRLKSEYGIDAGRNAIGRNVSLLLEMGYDISTYEENGKGAYLREREFDDTELLVLIDSVLSSKYIPEGDAKRLIEKLSGLSTRFFRKKLPQIHMVSEWNHQRNRQFFYNLELLGEGIEQKKQMAFTYNRIKADGELHPIRKNKDRVNPYALVCTNGQYYLVCSYLSYDNLRHYRVDKITDIELLEKDAKPICSITGCEKGLNIAQYAREHNFMYGGKTERVVLKVRSDRAGDVLDSFGKTATMEKLDEEHIKVSVYGTRIGMRLWAMQFCDVCEVLEPTDLREEVKETIRCVGKKYGL